MRNQRLLLSDSREREEEPAGSSSAASGARENYSNVTAVPLALTIIMLSPCPSEP